MSRVYEPSRLFPCSWSTSTQRSLLPASNRVVVGGLLGPWHGCFPLPALGSSPVDPRVCASGIPTLQEIHRQHLVVASSSHRLRPSFFNHSSSSHRPHLPHHHQQTIDDRRTCGRVSFSRSSDTATSLELLKRRFAPSKHRSLTLHRTSIMSFSLSLPLFLGSFVQSLLSLRPFQDSFASPFDLLSPPLPLTLLFLGL